MLQQSDPPRELPEVVRKESQIYLQLGLPTVRLENGSS